MSEANDHPLLPGSQGLGQGQATLDAPFVASLYSQYGPELRRFLLGVLKDQELVGDVLQATFTRAIEVGHTARIETIKGWLYQVAFREALTVRRRQQTRQRASERLAALGFRQGEAPDETLVREETVAAVREAVATLPEEQSRVVWARLYEDKTFAQIASESGVPLGTVLTRMRLALKKLRRNLGSCERAGDGD